MMGSIFQMGSDDGLVCCFFDVLVAHNILLWRFLLHTFNRLVAFFSYFICVFIE